MKVIQLNKTSRNLDEAIRSLSIVEKPKPIPRSGQVLVKIEAAPCNPSDLLFLQGKYGVKKDLPAVPGWEGAGVVVENGGGLLGMWLKGKRVACGGQANSDGTWAEYYVADAKSCIPLHQDVDMTQGATMIINPLTAVGMVEQAGLEGHKALIQTAACSQVGRMVQVLAKKKGLPLINIVRRQEQVDELIAAGEEYILNTNDDDFCERLSDLAEQLKATIVFEAVAGEETGRVINAMPVGSKALVYGALSEKSCSGISPFSLIFQNKEICGFWLTEWLAKRGIFAVFQATRLVQGLIGCGDFNTKIRKTVNFENWSSALAEYHSQMTKGKVILCPSNNIVGD